jgi:hypothetical protein
VVLLAAACSLLAPASASAEPRLDAQQQTKQSSRPAPSPEEVDRAVDRAIRHLYGEHKPDLMWENVPYDERELDPDGKVKRHGANAGQWGGLTSLVTYALLAAGEDPGENPKLQQAINALGRAEIFGVYAVGMRAQVWYNLPKRPEYQQAMARDYQTLIEAIQGNDVAERRRRNLGDRNVGLFDYLPEETSRIDMSVSQYGVLGLWATARYGAQISPQVWNVMEQAWLRTQLEDGSWAYNGIPREEKPGTLSLATAGVASLFITQDYLRSTAELRGNQVNPAIERGLNYIGVHMPYLLGLKKPETPLLEKKSNAKAYKLYTLYGIERIGVASGRKYINGIDWYAEGARYLLEKQNSNGSWGSRSDTAFGILFLVNGRNPAGVTKLAYAQSVDDRRSAWNQRSRDVANLTEYIEITDERDLNWQIIQLDQAGDVESTVRELHDSPMAYLAAGGDLALRDVDLEAIKRYTQTGGLLLINADGGNRKLIRDIREMGETMFADEGYDWRVLPDDHPIYVNQKFNFRDARRKPELMGLSNGVRELMILMPDDAARDWQTRTVVDGGPLQLGVNLYLYSVGNLEQPPRGSTPLVDENSAIKTNRDVKVGRIRHGGNWNPEPAGWDRLDAVMHNEYKTDLKVETVDASTAELGSFDVLHLTGTGELGLDENVAKKLKTYVENGGTLLLDAAGGDSTFAESAEAQLRNMFGDESTELGSVLPTNHPLYRSLDEPIDTVGYTLFARRTVGGERKPRLRGISFENRLGVIFSREDLSHGLVGSRIGGITGYEPEDATRLVAASLLYAKSRSGG